MIVTPSDDLAVALSDDPSGDLQMRSCVFAEADHGGPRDNRWGTTETDAGEVFAQDAHSGDRAGSYKGRPSRASGRGKDYRLAVYLYGGCAERKITTFEEAQQCWDPPDPLFEANEVGCRRYLYAEPLWIDPEPAHAIDPQLVKTTAQAPEGGPEGMVRRRPFEQWNLVGDGMVYVHHGYVEPFSLSPGADRTDPSWNGCRIRNRFLSEFTTAPGWSGYASVPSEITSPRSARSVTHVEENATFPFFQAAE